MQGLREPEESAWRGARPQEPELCAKLCTFCPTHAKHTVQTVLSGTYGIIQGNMAHSLSAQCGRARRPPEADGGSLSCGRERHGNGSNGLLDSRNGVLPGYQPSQTICK